MTKQISLTQGLFATVDDEDFEYLNQWNWRAMKNKHTFYAIRNEGKPPFMKTVYMHRVIMETPKGMQVDHRDGHGLNNCRNNLRNCTGTQNKQNRTQYATNLSGYKGVHKHKDKWIAQINVNGTKIYLGRFRNIQDAAHTYDEAAKKYFGEFANTNSTGGTANK